MLLNGSIGPIAGWLGGSALVDIIIAVAMYILLRKLRRGEQESDILLNRLVKHVVGSGMVTAGVALLALALYIYDVFSVQAELADCPILVLPKLYANTVLISLNNRDLVHRGSDGEEHHIFYKDLSEEHGLLSSLRKVLSPSINNRVSLSVDPFEPNNLQGTVLTPASSQESFSETKSRKGENRMEIDLCA